MKGFVNHTKESGPDVEGSGEHIHSGRDCVSIIVADIETMGLEKEDQGSPYKI